MSTPPDGGPSGVYAELAVRPDCPVATVAREVPVHEFVPATGQGLPRLVLEGESAAPEETNHLIPVARADGSVVCRLSGDVECGVDRCPACAPGAFPLDPLDVHWEDGEFRVRVAAEDGDGVRRCVEGVSDELEVEPVRLSAADGLGGSGRRAVLDLEELTDRQRELARAAADRGYFEPEGPSADDVAEAMEISKSTLSEHLRSVQRELFDQLFRSDDTGQRGDR